MVACVLAQIFTGKGKPAPQIDDFLPTPKRLQTPEEMQAAFHAFALAYNATVEGTPARPAKETQKKPEIDTRTLDDLKPKKLE